MTDLALDWVIQQLHIHLPEKNITALWCTDENVLDVLPLPAITTNLHMITNRWDVAQQAQARGFKVNFSDFALHDIGDNTLDYFFYRVSKEKPVVHLLLNEAWRCLKPGGKLFIAGHKNEGIKTYIEKIAAVFGCDKNTQKTATSYRAVLQKKTSFNSIQRLDDSDYHALRPIPGSAGPILFSKPGLFGWNKIDQGSAFLIAQLDDILPSRVNPPLSCLDLGCGYGYLTFAAARLASCSAISRWIMTDNNAAAIATAAHNAQRNGLDVELIAADCADSISEKFDLILCNPPFHQGFSVDGDLTNKFLHNIRRLLSHTGIAILVVNQFIPLEKKAGKLFQRVTKIADNGSFKVIALEV